MEVSIYTKNTDMATGEIALKHMELFERVKMYFDKNVNINYNNSEPAEMYRGDKIAIHLWSTPTNEDLLLPDLNKAFGLTYCNDGVFTPTEGFLTFGEDIPLIQYKDNNFYFLYDVCEYGTDDEIKLMQLLIDGILVQLEGTQELVDAKIALYDALERARKCEAFIKRILVKERSNKSERERQLIKAKQDMENARQQVRNLVLSIKVQEDMLNRNGDSIVELQNMLNKELAVMSSNKKVKKVDIDEDGNIIVFTDTIYSNVIGKDKVVRRYRFGEYKIVISANNGDIKFYNQNKSDRHNSVWSDKDNHPHVDQDGRGCLGNASSLIMDCVDRYQWGVLVDVLINYLESVNVDDSAGKNYYRWEQVDAEGKKLPTQYNPNR